MITSPGPSGGHVPCTRRRGIAAADLWQVVHHRPHVLSLWAKLGGVDAHLPCELLQRHVRLGLARGLAAVTQRIVHVKLHRTQARVVGRAFGFLLQLVPNVLLLRECGARSRGLSRGQ